MAEQREPEEILRPITVSAKADGLMRLARYCPERAYVELRVPKTIKTLNTVTFRISSHDQGKSMHPILSNPLIILGFSDQSEHMHGTTEGSSTWFNAVAITPLGHDRVPRKMIERNLQATSEFHKMEIRWDSEDADESLRLWLANIRGDDLIQIIPRAEYLAWVNFVNEAEIELSGLESLKAPLLSPVSNSIVLTRNEGHETSNFYRALDESKQEIRLICLNPGAFEDPVSCSLVYTSLRDQHHTKYECLSYCWGDQNVRSNIELQYTRKDSPTLLKGPLSITSSLYAAMRHLRPKDGPPRTIWIDAICINQEDLKERVNQISIMKQIYSLAWNVVVWIGEGDEQTTKAIRTVQSVSGRYQTYLKEEKTQESLAKLHYPLLENNNFDAFIDDWPLFERPYFRRTWVVQEVFNAAKATVQCGQDLVSWQDLLRVSNCHARTRLKATSGFKAVMPPLFADLFEHGKIQSSHFQANRSADIGILEVLVAGLDLDATDPRDKLFALLQFGEETKDFDSLPPGLLPDYHKSPSDVFSGFTRWWITNHKSLRILSALHAETGRTWQETQCIGTTISLAGRPSWSIWYRGHSNWAKSILGLSTDCPYRASLDTVPDVNLILSQLNPAILPLKGIRISTISKVMPYPIFQPDERSEPLKDIYIDLYDPVNEQRRWARSLFSVASYRTLEQMPHHLMDHLRTHYEYACETKAIECHSDCFFETVDEQVGLCVPYAREGDVVVVLFGGNVPFVLRQVERGGDRRYEFVGECYVEGFMDGRAVMEQREKRTESEVFELV